ncbi:unnamed protein product [Rhizoctonia solani]|uniref:Uncharacterized protein n=1 Tax=Rhizoctonia solani TaxID=456999 RepID=A0A8H3H4Y1_9AGAM|nr:unnamed protein product [Rhizoctonia solani]
MEFSPRIFAIQPEVDLMILLESCPIQDPRSRYLIKRYRIHVRTMTTNEPHPYVTSTPGTSYLLDLGSPHNLFFNYSRPIQIYGRMVSIIFRPDTDHPDSEPLIVVFDWILGAEVGRFYLPSYAGSSIAFLSEEYFVIPQGYRYTDTLPKDQHNQGGKLNLFYSPLYKEGVQSREVRCIASFAFPLLHNNQKGLSLRTYVAPALVPDIPYWSTRLKTAPKIYEQNPWNHLCLYYEVSDGENPLEPSYQWQLRFSRDLGTSGLLFISPQVLLTLLEQECHFFSDSLENPILIPWEAWGSYTISLPDIDLPDASIWGRKYIFLHSSSSLHSQDDCVRQMTVLELEFQQKPSQNVTNVGEHADTTVPGQDTTSNQVSCAYVLRCPAPAEQEAGNFEGFGCALPDINAYCKETTVELNKKVGEYWGVFGLMVNDEHFVGVEDISDEGDLDHVRVYTL